MQKNNQFPWGVYIGDLNDDEKYIPLLLDSKKGGFTLLYDTSSKDIAFNFIENIALQLLSVMPLRLLNIAEFDFGKKSFLHLASLEEANIYKRAYSPQKATTLFESIEELALDRHNNLFDFETPSLDEFNAQNDEPEPYTLLLINLDIFPDNYVSPKRIKSFFESAYDAGFYTIAFGTKDEIEQSDNKSTKSFLPIFPKIYLQNSNFTISKELFEYQELLDEFDFEYVNENKSTIIKSLLSQSKNQEQQSKIQNYLKVPIGKVGRKELYFELGDLVQSHHAFIAGTTGSGKTSLINKLLVEIAKNYSAKEIELYLMDYKPSGSEFIIYKEHPNCKYLFLENKDPMIAINILKEFQAEMTKRGELLQGKSLESYNKANPNNPLPRKILLIDEMQRMFEGDFKQNSEFNKLIKDIVKTGRSFGLHLILCTQTLKGAGLDKDTVAQMALKISLRLDNKLEAMQLFSENKEATDKVVSLKPYHFVYSDPNKTEVAKADYIDKEDIPTILKEIRASKSPQDVITPQLFDSKSQVANTQERSKATDSTSTTRDNFEYKSKYDTSKEKEALEKLNANKGKKDE